MRMCHLCGFTDLYDDLWFHFCPLNGNYTSELEDIDSLTNIEERVIDINDLEDEIEWRDATIDNLESKIKELEEFKTKSIEKLNRYKEDIEILHTFT